MRKLSISDALLTLKNSIPSNTTLVAVSKTKPVSDIQEAYDLGHRDFGENKVQELVQKFDNLPFDIRWHFIGHLQTNKVKQLIGKVHLIHSVDSIKLLREINKRSANANVITNCLLQVHIAQEEQKFGFDSENIESLLEQKEFEFNHVNIQGLMGMATNTEDDNLIISEFQSLGKLFNSIKSTQGSRFKDFNILSMGMTSDYMLAINNGSNMIRIGSLIFGHRS